MESLKQEYRQFLNHYFKGLVIRQPLFYNWKYGLRFDLQVGNTDTDEYFAEVVRRAITLFQAAFDPDDPIYFVLLDFKYKRRKIKISNYTFRQIKGLTKSQISFSKVKSLYEPDDRFDIRTLAVIKTTVVEINYKNLLTAITHSDFPSRKPRLDHRGIFGSKEIYLININKKLIFQMYDDRGLDIIADSVETLQPIYQKHNDWILDYDRERIDTLFKS